MVTCHVLFQCPAVGKLINKKSLFDKNFELEYFYQYLAYPLASGRGVEQTEAEWNQLQYYALVSQK